MTNEHYLIVSYFVCAALSMALGTLLYIFLRRSFDDVADTVSGKHMRSLLKKVFPLGIVLPALLGFMSVSYQSCERSSYEEIVQDRSYLVDKNQQQISSTLFSTAAAVVFWDVVVLLVIRFAESNKKAEPE